MKSGFKTFRVDAKWTRARVVGEGEIGEFNWDEVKAGACRQFDEWVAKENPQILSVNFGKVTGRSLDPAEQSHYWYIQVFYQK